MLAAIGIRRIAMCAACAAAALPWPASGDIFKWVDEKGVVNYGESPPQNRQAKRVDVDRAPVSVYSPAPDAGASSSEKDLSQKIDGLERELARKRSKADVASQQAGERETQRLERCRRDRRVDCDEILFEDYPPAVIYAPPAYWSKPPRPPVSVKPPRRPKPAPREEPREAPRTLAQPR